jgi:hypothetical protein
MYKWKGDWKMTKVEQLLQKFLNDYGICCDTCRLYYKNAKNYSVRDYVCFSGKNMQLSIHGSMFFTPPGKSFACEQWLDLQNEEDDNEKEEN